MSIAEYQMDRLFLPNKSTLLSRYADYFILCLVATIGLIGSLYVFANKSLDVNLSTQVEASPIIPKDMAMLQPPILSRDKFDSYIKMEGELKATSNIQFTLIPDLDDARYYLDMGNKERVIITQQNFVYTYKEAGTYTLELKVLRNRLLTTIASKKVNIK